MYNIPANVGFTSNLVHYLPTCHSTNEIAANLVAQGVDEGYIVITDHQTAGKGQRGNSWESKPFSNLTFSVLLKPGFLKVNEQFQLTQAISMAIATVVQDYVPAKVKIKWPNDIYVHDYKIAGILIQNSLKGKLLEASIVGIGLNVNQLDFSTSNATSLKKLTGKSFDLNTVLAVLVEALGDQYQQLKAGKKVSLNNEYQKLLYARNEVRAFENNKRFSGEIIGTDQLGRLLVKTTNGIKCFQNQEVKLIRT